MKYQKPSIEIVNINIVSFICTSTGVSNVVTSDEGVDISYGGGGAGVARSREHGGSDWDD